MAVIGNMSMDELSVIRKMIHADAERYLERFDLTSEERERVTPLIGKDLIEGIAPIELVTTYYDPTRRLWMAGVWLLGASFRQIADFHEITSQTVIASMSRVLPQPGRMMLRIGKGPMPLEHIPVYRRVFETNKKLLATMEPLAIAEWLRDHTDLSD